MLSPVFTLEYKDGVDRTLWVFVEARFVRGWHTLWVERVSEQPREHGKLHLQVSLVALYEVLVAKRIVAIKEHIVDLDGVSKDLVPLVSLESETVQAWASHI